MHKKKPAARSAKKKAQSKPRARAAARNAVYSTIEDESLRGKPYPIVGVGASAGGFEAFRQLLKDMPPNAGMALVLIQHLDPGHESMLTRLLSKSSQMPIREVREGMAVEPNHVYVIPPGKALASADGFLHLSELPQEQGRRVAVDLFFRTLADTHGPHATAIVLSGTDGDGAIGIKRIKERGGLTIAQEPDEAEHPDSGY